MKKFLIAAALALAVACKPVPSTTPSPTPTVTATSTSVSTPVAAKATPAPTATKKPAAKPTPVPPTSTVTVSPDGKTQCDSAVAASDTAEVARVAALVKADPADVAGPSLTDWTAALVNIGQPATSYPTGPYGVKFVYTHSQVSDPIRNIPFAASEPSTVLLAWRGQTGTPFGDATPDFLKPYLAQLNLKTKPGWQLGCSPTGK